MKAVPDGVVLMAGAGSRLRVGGHKTAKPLVPLLGRALVSYTLQTLADAGVKRVFAVVGFERETLMPQIEAMSPPGMEIRFVENAEWQKQNGISLLAAAPSVSGHFLLTMADHVFEAAIVDLLVAAGVDNDVLLAVDRKTEDIFDLADAMKVQTEDDRIIAIGKDLRRYDAIDTGVFLCSHAIFDFLERAKQGGDCSLADGVRLMAAERCARVLDVGSAWWQDVDTPEMLIAAEKYLRARVGSNHAAASVRRTDERNAAENQTQQRHRRPKVENPLGLAD